MSLAWVSLVFLLIIILVSCTNRVHPGFLAITFSWILVTFISPWFENPLSFRTLIAGFPTDLFLTLTGVNLLFTQAYLNGTLDRIAHGALGLCRGNVGLIPWMFFLLASSFSTFGAGNIAAAALIAPTAMMLAGQAKISPVLMTLMVGHGSLAGALSPISPTGLIANNQMNAIHLPGHGMEIFLHNFAANTMAALASFILFGGIKLFSRSYTEPEPETGQLSQDWKFRRSHWVTILVIAILLASVLIWKIDLGMGGFAGAVFLAMIGVAEDKNAVKKMPWSVILMVCGVNILTSLLKETGGNKLFADLVVFISNETTAPAVLGFSAAVVSVYSSTSGVVIPGFLPMVEEISANLGCDPVGLALGVMVAGHLVDSSPLSTIGALCVAGARLDQEGDRQQLFSTTLVWGMGMAVVGALWNLVFYGLLR